MFTAEHEMLRKAVRAFVEREVVPHAGAWEQEGRIPRSFWRRLGELGFLGLDFPGEHGGAGGDFLSSVVLGEEMARCRSGGVAFSVLVHTDMSSPWLVRFGTEAQKRKYLPGIVRGETVCALGITEPGTGSDMAALANAQVSEGLRGRALPAAGRQQGEFQPLLQAQQQVAHRVPGEQVAHARLLGRCQFKEQLQHGVHQGGNLVARYGGGTAHVGQVCIDLADDGDWLAALPPIMNVGVEIE